MRRKLKPRDYLGKGYKVVIKRHVIDRYVERSGVSREEAEATLETKFRNSRLTQLLPDGSERRMEVGGSLTKRLIFVAIKKGRTFVVITCYLQGSRNNWWKNEGLIIENDPEEDFKIKKKEITTELEQLYKEEINSGQR